MFLESACEQEVVVADKSVHFATGERLHTENSYKYHPEEFIGLAEDAGFATVSHFTDVQDWFSFFVLRAQ